MLQTLLTPLVITLVVCGMLFFYFRNRLALTERKVNLMFDLIQEHEKRSRIAESQYLTGQIPTPIMNPTEQVANPGLIDISDNESTASESESDSDSDDSDADKLHFAENLEPPDGIKSVTLTLEGAETGQKPYSLSEIDDPLEVSAEALDKTDIKEINIKPVLEPVISDLNDIELSDNEEDDDEDLEEDDDQEEEDDSDTVTAPKDENNTVVKKLDSEKPLEKRSIKQLHAECITYGLSGYKKMKKSALIDLLTENSIKQSTLN